MFYATIPASFCQAVPRKKGCFFESFFARRFYGYNGPQITRIGAINGDADYGRRGLLGRRAFGESASLVSGLCLSADYADNE
jgi:hypothetical protein